MTPQFATWFGHKVRDLFSPLGSMSQRDHIECLDGLRGLAVLIVVASHLSNAGFLGLGFVNFSGIGKSGVYLFFVLSAFLLSTPFVAKTPQELRSGLLWLTYFWRRFFRIYPLYVIILVVSLISTLLLGNYTNGWGFPYSINGKEFFDHVLLLAGKSVLWSIAVEFKFYFFLPVIVYILVVAAQRNLLMAAAAAAGAIFFAEMYLRPAATSDVSLSPYLSIFIVGSACAFIGKKISINNFHSTSPFAVLFFAGIAAWIVLIPAVYSFIFEDPAPAEHIHSLHLTFALIWAAVLLGLLGGPTVLRRALSLRPLVVIGRISFSVYLIHAPIISVSRVLLDKSVVSGLLILTVSLLLSAITYSLVEKPCSRLRPPWINRQERMA